MSKTKKTSFLHDGARVLSSNVFALAITFINGMVLARCLGPEGKGLLAALVVYPALFVGLAEMGIRQASVYFLGNKVYSEQEIVSVLSLLLVVSSCFGIAVCGGVFISIHSSKFTLPMILLSLLTIPLQLVASYSSGVFLGKGQISRFSNVQWMSEAAKFAVTLVLVLLVGLKVFGALIAIVVGCCIVAFYAIWLVSRTAVINLKFNISIIKSMLRVGIVYAISLFILQMNYKIDIALMERLSTTKEIGQYTLGVSIVELLWQLPSAIGVVVFSRSSNAENSKDFSRNASKLMRVSLLAVVFGAVVCILSAKFIVPAVYGVAFLPSVDVIRLLAPGIVAFTIIKVLNMDMAGKGKPMAVMYAALPSLLLNIVLNYMWIPTHGAKGAALASTCSYSIAGVLYLFVYAKTSGLPLRELLLYRKSDFDFLLKLKAKLIKS